MKARYSLLVMLLVLQSVLLLKIKTSALEPSDKQTVLASHHKKLT